MLSAIALCISTKKLISFTSFGFYVENGIKIGGYIQEKLNMKDDCGDELANLINGIIGELNAKD